MRRGNGGDDRGSRGSGPGSGVTFSKPENSSTATTSFETESASLLGSSDGTVGRHLGTRAQNAARNVALLGDSILAMAWYTVIMPLGSMGNNNLTGWMGTILPLLMLTGAFSSFLAPNSESANNYYLGTRTSFYGFAFLLFANIASYYVVGRSEMFGRMSVPAEVVFILVFLLGMSFLSFPIWRRLRRHELTESLPMNLMFSDEYNPNIGDRSFKKD